MKASVFCQQRIKGPAEYDTLSGTYAAAIVYTNVIEKRIRPIYNFKSSDRFFTKKKK